MYQRRGDEMIEHGSKLGWQALAGCIKFEQPITISATQPFKKLSLYNHEKTRAQFFSWPEVLCVVQAARNTWRTSIDFNT